MRKGVKEIYLSKIIYNIIIYNVYGFVFTNYESKFAI